MKIFSPDNKYVGDIIENTYYTSRKPEHFMVKFLGFGISESILSTLKELKVNIIQINYLGKELIKYSTYLEKYLKSIKQFKYNNDLQYFVSIADMKINQ